MKLNKLVVSFCWTCLTILYCLVYLVEMDAKIYGKKYNTLTCNRILWAFAKNLICSYLEVAFIVFECEQVLIALEKAMKL